MSDTDDAGRTAAQAAGLERYFRRATINGVNAVLVVLVVVGGLAVWLARDASSPANRDRAVEAVVFLSLSLALLAVFLLVMRYLGVRRRLVEAPAAEVARLSAKPGRHRRRFFAGGEPTGPRRPAGGISDDPVATRGDPYVGMRNMVGLGTDASPDGVNRSGDPEGGPIE